MAIIQPAKNFRWKKNAFRRLVIVAIMTTFLSLTSCQTGSEDPSPTTGTIEEVATSTTVIPTTTQTTLATSTPSDTSTLSSNRGVTLVNIISVEAITCRDSAEPNGVEITYELSELLDPPEQSIGITLRIGDVRLSEPSGLGRNGKPIYTSRSCVLSELVPGARTHFGWIAENDPPFYYKPPPEIAHLHATTG